ncbi:MAG TPA: bestrophin family ion channel [Bacteroidia bacterium]|nr:bestrophin family ion channel [Bacteroidia bacterium]
MINYNSRAWFTLIFKFHKSDTLRMLLPAMLGLAAFATFIIYLELEVFKVSFKSASIMFSLLGFVISMLLVFRTNTAYERWWEGRKLWGSLVNSSRNMAIKLNAFLPEKSEHKAFFAEHIPFYAFVLKEHLRGNKVAKLNSSFVHQPNYVALLIAQRLKKMQEEKLITGEQLIVLNQEFTNFTDVCGACERIRKTPIPYSYSLFLKKFIFVYIISMPFGFVNEAGYGIVPVMVFVFYVLASLELIAEEIEDPFGSDANDLPLDEIAETIDVNINELLT